MSIISFGLKYLKMDVLLENDKMLIKKIYRPGHKKRAGLQIWGLRSSFELKWDPDMVGEIWADPDLGQGF